MMVNKCRNLTEKFLFRLLAILIGLLMLGIVLVVSARSDLSSAEKHLSSIASYVKDQYSTYSTTKLASETKSLMRVMESAQHISLSIEERSSSPELSPLSLRDYVRTNYLSGVFLMDKKGNVIKESYTAGLGMDVISKYISPEAYLYVASHSEETYAARLECEDSSYIDFAVYGLADGSGLVGAYYHTPLEYIKAYSLSYKGILSGYRQQQDGTVVVTKGSRIIDSNDESLIGKNSEDIPVLSHINEQGQSSKMLAVRTEESGVGHSFGLVERSRDYYVYAYMPERDVFETAPGNFLLALFCYVVILLMVQFLRWKTAQSYQQRQLLQEREYQQKLMESAKKAESANIAKTEFLQRMSHDIRTPINGIRGMVEIGNYYADDPRKQAECRRKIWDASGLLLELVNEVLDMGKLESGEIVLESRPFNVSVLLEEILSVLEKQADERGITITYRRPDLPYPNVLGSPLHVKRLLMNIISNAVKYNKDGGSVTITCKELPADKMLSSAATSAQEYSKDDESDESKDPQGKENKEEVMFEFVCADTGIGMSPEFQKHVFEPFTQEGAHARSTYNGTGLGMSIAKSLVDKMGGTIEFESTQNVGTTYFIRLPFEVCHELPAEAQADINEVVSDISLAGFHILVAEDNELNMEIAAFMLENAGATIEKAFNGEEAVQCFKQSPEGFFDVILMDIMMPVMGGYEASRIIRSMKRSDAETVPIIAMTANAFPEDRQKAHQAGMNEHLTKPLEAAPLLKLLAKYCSTGNTGKN